MDAGFMRRLRHLHVEVIGQAGEHRFKASKCLAEFGRRREIRRLHGEGQLFLRRPGIESRDLEACLPQQRRRQRADLAQAQDRDFLE